MKKIFVLIFVMVLNFALFAVERTVEKGNSYAEFPFIVFVGQIVEITPFSVVFENTLYETGTNNDKIGRLIRIFEQDTDFRSHGMANALRAASVKDGKMRLAFYVDNIAKIFSNDASTYVRYLPLFHLFENNIKEVTLTPQQIEEIKKMSAQYFLDLPMTKELIKDSWLAGVFQISPTNDRLIYKSARFFKDFDELNQSKWAQDYRIPDIVRKGMTVSMTKAIYIGHESEDVKSKDKKKGGKSGQNKKQFDNRIGAPVGKEK